MQTQAFEIQAVIAAAAALPVSGVSKVREYVNALIYDARTNGAVCTMWDEELVIVTKGFLITANGTDMRLSTERLLFMSGIELAETFSNEVIGAFDRLLYLLRKEEELLVSYNDCDLESSVSVYSGTQMLFTLSSSRLIYS